MSDYDLGIDPRDEFGGLDTCVQCGYEGEGPVCDHCRSEYFRMIDGEPNYTPDATDSEPYTREQLEAIPY